MRARSKVSLSGVDVCEAWGWAGGVLNWGCCIRVGTYFCGSLRVGAGGWVDGWMDGFQVDGSEPWDEKLSVWIGGCIFICLCIYRTVCFVYSAASVVCRTCI